MQLLGYHHFIAELELSIQGHKTYTSLISKRSRSTVPVLFVLRRLS